MPRIANYPHSPLPLTSKCLTDMQAMFYNFLNYTVVISFIERSQDNYNLKLAVISVFKLTLFHDTWLTDTIHSEHCQTYLTWLMLIDDFTFPTFERAIGIMKTANVQEIETLKSWMDETKVFGGSWWSCKFPGNNWILAHDNTHSRIYFYHM